MITEHLLSPGIPSDAEVTAVSRTNKNSCPHKGVLTMENRARDNDSINKEGYPVAAVGYPSRQGGQRVNQEPLA